MNFSDREILELLAVITVIGFYRAEKLFTALAAAMDSRFASLESSIQEHVAEGVQSAFLSQRVEQASRDNYS